MLAAGCHPALQSGRGCLRKRDGRVIQLVLPGTSLSFRRSAWFAGASIGGTGSWIQPRRFQLGSTDAQQRTEWRLHPGLGYSGNLEHGKHAVGRWMFLVMGDQLWFYFSGRNGPHASTVGATGLATLRRDGFYSMDAGTSPATLTTRPVQFSGKYLFVNVSDPQGSLQIQVLNLSNGAGARIFASAEHRQHNSTSHVGWSFRASELAGQPVEFQFNLTNGELIHFG